MRADRDCLNQASTCINVGEIPHVTSRAIASPKYERRCLGRKESFRDCSACPEMIVVPTGMFTMGSPIEEAGRDQGETQVAVTMPTHVAVSKFARGEFAANNGARAASIKFFDFAPPPPIRSCSLVRSNHVKSVF